jgi:hypothetical protein
VLLIGRLGPFGTTCLRRASSSVSENARLLKAAVKVYLGLTRNEGGSLRHFSVRGLLLLTVRELCQENSSLPENVKCMQQRGRTLPPHGKSPTRQCPRISVSDRQEILRGRWANKQATLSRCTYDRSEPRQGVYASSDTLNVVPLPNWLT